MPIPPSSDSEPLLPLAAAADGGGSGGGVAGGGGRAGRGGDAVGGSGSGGGGGGGGVSWRRWHSAAVAAVATVALVWAAAAVVASVGGGGDGRGGGGGGNSDSRSGGGWRALVSAATPWRPLPRGRPTPDTPTPATVADPLALLSWPLVPYRVSDYRSSTCPPPAGVPAAELPFPDPWPPPPRPSLLPPNTAGDAPPPPPAALSCLDGATLPVVRVLRPPLAASPDASPELRRCLDAAAAATRVPIPGWAGRSVTAQGMNALTARFSAALRTYPRLAGPSDAADLTLLLSPVSAIKLCAHAQGVPWQQAATALSAATTALAASLDGDDRGGDGGGGAGSSGSGSGGSVASGRHALLLDVMEWRLPPVNTSQTLPAHTRYDLPPALRRRVVAASKERFAPRGYPSDVLPLPMVSSVSRAERLWELRPPRPTVVAYVGTLDDRPYGGANCSYDPSTGAWAPFYSGGCLRSVLRRQLRAHLGAAAGGTHPSPQGSGLVRVSVLARREESFHAGDAAALMLSSRYCLQPAGDGMSRRGLFDSLLCGCVPVVFRPSMVVLPFEDVVPYEDFTVTLPETDVLAGHIDVVAALAAIPDAEYEQRLSALRTWAPRLAYGHEPADRWRLDDPDAFTLSILALAHAAPVGTFTRDDLGDLYQNETEMRWWGGLGEGGGGEALRANGGERAAAAAP
ncbi:hypothetical protein MMPV_005887 [Pyropia vietnamensis]